MTADKVSIVTDAGERVEAAAPVIVSASRSTDVPAFYARWFFNRLARGYCVWRNPFNQQPMYISFSRCRVVVFWTKNPAPIIPYLSELDRRGIHYYFQYTLNDYEAERLEPNVPPLAERIATFKRLSQLIGRERVIWRFDPIVMTPQLTPRQLLTRIWHIGNELRGLTDKLVFSFVDVAAYRKVQGNLVKDTSLFTRDNVSRAEPGEAQRTELVEGLARLRDAWRGQGWNIELATCAEAIDLDRYGIAHNRCIDGELMKRIFADDSELVYYLHTGRLPEGGMLPGLDALPPQKDLKDKGQRRACGCMISKDIGAYNTCRHLCAYCYANSNRDCVVRNAARHSDLSESITQ